MHPWRLMECGQEKSRPPSADARLPPPIWDNSSPHIRSPRKLFGSDEARLTKRDFKSDECKAAFKLLDEEHMVNHHQTFDSSGYTSRSIRELAASDTRELRDHEYLTNKHEPPQDLKELSGSPRTPTLQRMECQTEELREHSHIRSPHWDAVMRRASSPALSDPSVHSFIHEHRWFLSDKRPPTPLQRRQLSSPGGRQLSPARLTTASQYASPWSSPTRAMISGRELHTPTIKEQRDAILYPSYGTVDHVDIVHPGYSKYHWWKDQQQRDIEASKKKLLLHSSVKARCEQMRAHLPEDLKLNPDARGIKGINLTPCTAIKQAHPVYHSPRYGGYNGARHLQF